MKYIKDVIVSKQEPPKNVMWLKPTESDTYELSFFGSNGWTKIGGETAEPTNVNIKHIFEHGGDNYFQLYGYDLMGTNPMMPISTAIIGKYAEIGEYVSIGKNVKIPDGWDATLFKPGTSTSDELTLSMGPAGETGHSYIMIGTNFEDAAFAVPESFKVHIDSSWGEGFPLIINVGEKGGHGETTIKLGSDLELPSMRITSDSTGLTIQTAEGKVRLSYNG